jgi:flagellar hook protein FlgE
MSVLGALNAAVGGMDAQAAALSAISNNVANSQTVGFKETGTSFVNYVTQASATAEAPGQVVALPEYENSIAGTVTSTGVSTSLAISGNGFFAVSQPVGTPGSGNVTYSPTQYYTQAGDFSLNANGNLENSEGYVLDGYPASNAAGTAFNTNALAPIQISEAPSPPVPTTQVGLGANIGSTPPAGTTSYSSTADIYDAGGNQQTLNMTWTQVTAAGPVSATNPISTTNPVLPNEWDLTVSSPNSTPSSIGPMQVTFSSGTGSTAGTISSITYPAGTTGTATLPATQTTGSAATISLPLNFGFGTQAVALNLGSFGSTTGVTQFSGTSYAQASAPTQNGMPQGQYSGVTIQAGGDVTINYSNGATQTVAQVPLATFANADALQSQSGQAFTATIPSGAANISAPGTGPAGTLVAGSVEGSNVDIATQFTQMIVAQQAYTANSKVITTANSMLQDAVGMIQG